MEEDPGPPASEPAGRFLSPPQTLRSRRRRSGLRLLVLLCPCLASCGPARHEDVIARIARTGTLVYGSDKEGGGPYIFPDPADPRAVAGFEVELMRSFAASVEARPVFAQGPWDRLLQVLDAGNVDMVVNGYEWTEARARSYAATRPYYVYQLQLLAANGGPVRTWGGLKTPGPGGQKWRVGTSRWSGSKARPTP